MGKFPLYRQHNQMDCGPTCLRMVAKYYGKDYTLFSENALQKVANDLKAKVEIELEAIENERNRIANDIHDEVIGNLTTAIIEIDVIQVEKNSTSLQTNKTLNNITDKLNKSVESLREIIYGLSSRTLLSSDFNSIVSNLCSKYDSIKQLKAKFRANDQAFELTSNQKQQLFRIIQELLTNSIKHSNAQTVNVCIIWSIDSIELKYSDNGKGLEPSIASAKHSAYGLNGIALRAQSIGATYQFLTPERGMGFSLNLSKNSRLITN